MSFIEDLQDGSGYWLLDVWPYETSPVVNAPDTAFTPACLLSVYPDTLNPANVGRTSFRLVFSEPMDSAATLQMAVTFGLESPYDTHVVAPRPRMDRLDHVAGRFLGRVGHRRRRTHAQGLGCALARRVRAA